MPVARPRPSVSAPFGRDPSAARVSPPSPANADGPPRPGTGASSRSRIDAGLTGDKVPVSDPAAAPMPTDAEAGGSPTDAEMDWRSTMDQEAVARSLSHPHGTMSVGSPLPDTIRNVRKRDEDAVRALWLILALFALFFLAALLA